MAAADKVVIIAMKVKAAAKAKQQKQNEQFCMIMRTTNNEDDYDELQIC